MTFTKTHLFIFLAGIAIGALCGFFFGKAVYDTTDSIKVERDTIYVTDTVRYYVPTPVYEDKVRTEYKWLTRVDHVIDTNKMVVHDSVLVEVPITSKHYKAKEYDAWISGYEPSLDSIRVYQEKEYITEKITITKTKRKPWGIGFSAGYGYDIKTKTASPFIGVGISYDIISF